MLGTLSEHSGKGAGRMLVQWGSDKADADNLQAFLFGTPPAKSLYSKMGFEVAEECFIDFSPWNVDSWYMYAMVRQPKTLS